MQIQIKISTINMAWSAGSHLAMPITLTFVLLAALNMEANIKITRYDKRQNIFRLQCQLS